MSRDELEVVLPVRREVVLDGRGIPTGERATASWAPGPLGARTLDAEYDAWDGDVVLRGGGGLRHVAPGEVCTATFRVHVRDRP